MFFQYGLGGSLILIWEDRNPISRVFFFFFFGLPPSSYIIWGLEVGYVERADGSALCLIWARFIRIRAFLLIARIECGSFKICCFEWMSIFNFMLWSQSIRMWRNRRQQGALSHRWAPIHLPIIYQTSRFHLVWSHSWNSSVYKVYPS